ncbi:Ankyrin repeat domain-containing protein [Penicillium chrysogenum]|uniref:Ankyrin repeat domain-containing protein n=1 Tax=Penicillium chrysogenum TaxID=5076 RepID=A0A167UNW9_PENCH|nr:Ankyrin repeat domain-containing protein [Penicillium chrysogenum]
MRSLSHRFRRIKSIGTTTFKRVLHSRSQLDNSRTPNIGPTDTPLVDEVVLTPTSEDEPSDLWDRAEKALRNSPDGQTRKIMETYLSILESELGFEIAGMASSDRQKQLSNFTVNRIQALDEKKWRVRLRENHVSVESILTGIANNVLAVKDIVSTAAAADPHVALACAGVTLLIRSVNEHKALLSGFDYTSKLICQFNVMGKLYMSRKDVVLASADDAARFATEFEASMLDLYSGVLEFQARALCHLSRHPIRQRFIETFEVDSWKGKLADIKDSETLCRNFTSVIDSVKLHSGLEKHEQNLLKVRENTDDILHSLRKQTGPQTASARDEFLKVLYTSCYEDHKDRNQEAVQGTCEWFTTNPLFEGWRDNTSSCLLWVSADPGCGKSVLAKSLVDHKIRRSEKQVICYFFFKDDHTEQKSAVNALCAILRQLFLQNEKLLHKSILDDFGRDPGWLTKSFSSLWDLLVKVASNPDAGEIVCVLDALDECEGGGCSQLIQALNRYYRRVNSKSLLKFLVTSRPYAHILREFQPLKNHVPEIHLSGEDDVETEKISDEINLVIHNRVEEMGDRLQLESHERAFLRNQLLLMSHRTYLWVTLIFDVIENSISYTNARVQEIIHTLPRTVDEAYENILARSPDQEKAKRLLHIVVSAVRPMTLKETRIALAIRPTDRTYEDLDLESETRFPAVTAKEFLVKKAETGDTFTPRTEPRCSTSYSTVENRPHSDIAFSHWKHSLVPTESNSILNEICIAYLLFEDFESCLNPEQNIGEYTQEHVFLEYAAKNWAEHFHAGAGGAPSDIRDGSYEPLENAAKNGHFRVVEILLSLEKAFLDTECLSKSRALYKAAKNGHEAVVKLLLASGAEADRDPVYESPLLSAAEGGHLKIVRLLLEQEGIDLTRHIEGGNTPLIRAAARGHDTVVKFLLCVEGVDPDCRNHAGYSSLCLAVRGGHTEVVKLLIATNAVQLDMKDALQQTPLVSSLREGHDSICKLLLGSGAQDVGWDDIHPGGRTALSIAAELSNETMFDLLLGTGKVKPDSKSTYNRTPLSYASESGATGIVKRLLNTEGVDPDLADTSYGRTPLSWAAVNGHFEVVQLLLDSPRVDVSSCDFIYGRTPREWALVQKHSDVAHIIRQKEIQEGRDDVSEEVVSPECDGDGEVVLQSTPPWAVPVLVFQSEGDKDGEMHVVQHGDIE